VSEETMKENESAIPWSMQLQEMEGLLSSLKKDAHELAVLDDGTEDNHRRKRVPLDENQKRERSTSSWAKSKVPNGVGLSNTPKTVHQSLNVDKAANHIRTNTPVYSFPRTGTQKKAFSDEVIVPGPQDYHVSDGKISTKKRPISATFSREKREVFTVKNNDSSRKTEDGKDVDDDSEYEIIEEEYIIPKGSSFPKAKRFHEEKPETNSPETEPSTRLDTEKSHKALLPNTPGPVMRPKSASSSSRKNNNQNNNYEDLVMTSEPKLPINQRVDINNLSTRYRSPAVQFYKEASTTEKRKPSSADVEQLERLRGPGFYSVDDQAIRFTTKGHGIATGTVIHKEKEHKLIPHAQATKVQEKLMNERRGPGYYDASATTTGNSIPGAGVVKFSATPSEPKMTAQLAKKKYFEEKHQLALEDKHSSPDNQFTRKSMLLASPNDTYLRPKTPTVSFDHFTGRERGGKKNQRERSRSRSRDSTNSLNSYNRYNSSTRRSSNRSYFGYSDDEEDKESESKESFSPSRIQFRKDGTLYFDNTNSITSSKKNKKRRPVSPYSALMPSKELSYNVKYDFVEKRVANGLSMKSEVASRARTKELIKNKPNAIDALSDQRKTPTPNKFYGPQLQVPWVPDKESMSRPIKKVRTKTGGGDGDEHDEDGDGGESPTEEILQMLADRAEGGKPVNEEEMKNKQFTDAYLRSSFSGSLIKKPNPVKSFIATSKVSEKQLEQENITSNLEFLGPQLPVDWTSPAATKSSRFKQPTIEFNKITSRDKIKVHSKGIVEKEEFVSSQLPKTDDFGPGKYDVMSNIAIANAKSRNVIQFDKIVSREDQIRQNGERPVAAYDNSHLNSDEELEFNGQLDIDFGAAKDLADGRHKKKGISLYTTERYPKEPERKRTFINEDGEEVEIPEGELGLDDHLGGSWFEGMAEQTKKKSAKHLEFHRMTGRKDMKKEEEDLLYAKEIEKEMDIEGVNAPLDLEVKDYQPHKPKAKATEFTDAKKDPRFLKQEKPKYYKEKELTEEDIQRENEMNSKLLFNMDKNNAVKMDRMIGRKDNDEEEKEYVDRLAVGGEIANEEEADELERERQERIDSYNEKKFSKPIVKNIDFNKQMEKDIGKTAKQKEFEEDILREAIDETRKNYQAYEEPDVHERKKISNVSNDLVKFERMKGRKDMEVEEEIMKEELKGQEDEELDLNPKKTEFLSK
jgi:hypothetical protein